MLSVSPSHRSQLEHLGPCVDRRIDHQFDHETWGATQRARCLAGSRVALIAAVSLLALVSLAVGSCSQKSDDAPVRSAGDTNRQVPETDDTATGEPNTQAGPEAAKETARVVFETKSGDVGANVEVVRSERDIRRGLMYRTHLPQGSGMLFLFKKEKFQSFWMKNTLISLDMIFIRGKMTVAGVVANTKPRTKMNNSVPAPSQFVLEMNAGWAKANRVAKGTTVRFEGVKDVPPPVLLGN